MPNLHALVGFLSPLEISAQEDDMLVNLTEALTQHNLAQCSTVLVTKDGHADSRAWKELRHKDNIRVYKERPRSKSMPSTPSLLLLGKMQGKLDDVMYAIVSQTDVPDVSAIGSLSHPMKMRVNCLQTTASGSETIIKSVHCSKSLFHFRSLHSMYSSNRPDQAIHIQSRDPFMF